MTARTRSVLVLIGCLIVCFAVAAAGGAITATSVGTWYQALHKPPFNPPDWVFAPVWNLLFAMMAVAGWRVWRRDGFIANRTAFGMFTVQLALNLAWSLLFFGIHAIGVAFIEMVVLWAAILLTTVMFWRLDGLAGVLMVPYGAWVAFALVLNGAIWGLN